MCGQGQVLSADAPAPSDWDSSRGPVLHPGFLTSTRDLAPEIAEGKKSGTRLDLRSYFLLFPLKGGSGMWFLTLAPDRAHLSQIAGFEARSANGAPRAGR